MAVDFNGVLFRRAVVWKIILAMKVENIPLEQITPDPRQPREKLPGIPELVASIKKHGVLQPVGVRPVTRKTSDHKYMLIFGGRRFEAAMQAGMPTIPAIIRVGNDSTLGLQIVENMQRRDLTVNEYADGIQRLITDEGMTKSQVAKMLGIGASDVSKRLALRDAPAEVQELLMQRPDSLSHALEIRNVKDASFRAELASQAARGASVESIRETIAKAAKDTQWRKDSQTPDKFTRDSLTKHRRHEKEAEKHVEERIVSILHQLSALPGWIQNCGAEYSGGLPDRWDQMRYAITRCEKAR